MLLSATLRSLSVVVVGAFVSFCTVQSLMFCQCAGAEAQSFTVDFAESMVWQQNESGVEGFTNTAQLPLIEGTSFGWRLHLEDASETVRIREVFVLPSAPKSWGIGPETTLSQDGRIAITEEVAQTNNGWVGHVWSIAEGDPPGPYEMHVFINDRLVRVFHFNAVVPAASSAPQKCE